MDNHFTIGVVGNGFVGQACRILGECPNVECLVFDIDPTKCIPCGLTMESLCHRAELIFVCVPTPAHFSSGQCDTSIVERVIHDLCRLGASGIIVRSTVPPGTCSRLGVMHMPEYLTERNWREDFRRNPTWHVGVPLSTSSTSSTPLFDFKTACQRLQTLLSGCKDGGVIESDKIELYHSDATEMAKYMRNCFLATKVALCNEIEQFCQQRQIDYESVRQMAIQDDRIGSSHTAVPGPDGKRGYGGTCLPKDAKAMIFEMRASGCQPIVLEACDKRNDEVDRPCQDWKQIGRSISQ